MSKEEAIKKLNSIVKVHKDFLKGCKEEKISEKEIEAIETVLGYVKELEKGITRLKDKNKKLSEEIIDVKVDKVTRNFIPKQEHEEKIKLLEEERDGIYADYQDLGKAYYDSIPKQVIKELKEKIHNTLDKNGITRGYQLKIDEYFDELLKEDV